MLLVPAIDLYRGRCVRLYQGDFEKVTPYDFKPIDLARRYAAGGASRLHIVDLDAAKTGAETNINDLRAIGDIDGISVQCGGGFRSRARIEHALMAGISRVVVGSLVLSAPAVLRECLQEFGTERITLALDVRLDDGNPMLASHGWKQQSAVSLWDTLEEYQALGIRDVLCTDIARDGAMEGPNLALYAACVARFPAIKLQASGGVRNVDDLHRLAELGVDAAIVGKALYQHPTLLEEAKRFLRSE